MFGTAIAPAGSVPMKLPLIVVFWPPLETPAPLLPEMTFPPRVPPIVLPMESPSRDTPAELPSDAEPSAVVPIRLSATAVLEAACRKIPMSSLPETRFAMIVLAVALSTLIPTPLSIAAVPCLSVPIRFPSTVAPVAKYSSTPFEVTLVAAFAIRLRSAGLGPPTTSFAPAISTPFPSVPAPAVVPIGLVPMKFPAIVTLSAPGSA